MPKLLTALAVLVTSAFCFSSFSRADLVVHWPLDESSGTVASDTSGNNIDGDWQGSAGSAGWLAAGGIDGGAVAFTGSNSDSFITSSFSAVPGTPLTMSVWVKTTSTANDGLVYLGNGSSGNQYYVLRVQGNVARANARNTSEVAAAGVNAINDDEWHHVVGVYSGSSLRRLYVDGVLERVSVTNVSEVTLNRFGIGALTRSTPYNPADLYTGQLDDVALFDRAFSAGDIGGLRGLVLHGAGNAADVEDFMAAFVAQGSAVVRGTTWTYATGLAGSLGAISGSIAGGDASIVLDSSGNGMRLAGGVEPAVLSFAADFDAISPGVPVTLSWQLFNADTATLSGVGSVDPGGSSVVVNPAVTTTYTLSATNTEGTVTEDVTVTVAAGGADPSISEFLAKNDSGLRDEDGDFSDWIEIHNDSGFALDLAGYKLTNDPAQLGLWSFPAQILAADERDVVFASAKDRTGAEWHTNFTIDADGEYLALVRPDGSTIVQEFSPLFPPQSTDISYSPAGFHQPPTPGEPNAAGASAGVLKKKVTYGTPGGLFFGGTVNVALSHEDPNVTIRYTLDGSLPDATSTAYTAPIAITATTLIKAGAYRTDWIPGPLSQEGYIFADNSLSSFDSNLPIVVIDTFGVDVPRNDRVFKEAAFAVFEPGVSGRSALSDPAVEGGNSGIHVRGESSQLSGFNKLNFAFETRNTENEDKDVAMVGMPPGSDWALHASEIDRTFIREQLPHYLYREIGRYSPRTRPVEVFLNMGGGTVTDADYRGLYIIVERIRRSNDRVDIARLQPGENTEPDVTGGFIFKDDKGDPGDVNVSTPGEGNFAITYPNENNVTTAQRDYLQTYLRDFETALNGANFADPVLGYENFIDVQSWIDTHVIQELTKEVDSFHFSTYFHKDRGGKIVNGPLWDFDRSFGNVSNGNSIEDPTGWNDGSAPGDNIGLRGAFWERLFEDPDFMQLYIDRWQDLMETTLDVAHVHSIIDTMAAEVDEAKDRNFEPAGPWPLANVTRSHLTFPTYVEHVTYLKNWVSSRLAWVETQFTAKPTFGTTPGSFSGPLNLSLSVPAGTIYYTTDGSDPRADGGGIAGTQYTGAISISDTTTVIARARDGGEWSGPLSGSFIIGEPASAATLALSEIMYHPAAATVAEITAGFADEELFEYLEFVNVGANPIELADVVISDCFDFTFSAQELAPGARVLVVRHQAAFEQRYGAGQNIAGEYGDQRLANSGERILVTAAEGGTILDVSYGDSSPWPSSPDGDGQSLVFVEGDPDQPLSWRPSTSPNPGGSDSVSFTPGGDLIDYAIVAEPDIATGQLTFTLAPAADDAVVSLQFSTDLEAWADADLPLASRLDQTLVYTLPSPGGPRGYYRLLVENP